MNHRIRAAVSIGGRDTPKISVIADILTEELCTKTWSMRELVATPNPPWTIPRFL
jgi:hypothetical protein